MKPCLTDFLLARIAEDEEVARTVWPGRRSSRMRAECRAKRRIVERFKWIEQHPEWVNDMELSGEWEVAENTLMDLASIYADHPDCREERRR